MRIFCALLGLAALTACGKSDNDPGPGGVTVGEARALDEAAEMVEQRRMPASALRPPAPAPSASAAAR
jgi:hypothetical protein